MAADTEFEQKAEKDLQMDLDFFADNEADVAVSPPAKGSDGKRPQAARRGRGGGRGGGAAKRGKASTPEGSGNGASASSSAASASSSTQPATEDMALVEDDLEGECRSWGPKG